MDEDELSIMWMRRWKREREREREKNVVQ